MKTKSGPLKAVFIDRDGTLIYEPPDTRQVDSLEKLRILPHVISGLMSLADQGYKLIMVSNQDGLGTGSFPRRDFKLVQDKLLGDLKKNGIFFDEVFACPHCERDKCDCRKPKIGLLKKILEQNIVDKEKSFVIGDRESDKKFAENLGIKSYIMVTNSTFPRIGSAERNTKETQVFIRCNLDGQGIFDISTGVNFFNHMLEQFSRHSLIDLMIKARGDLQVDVHHIIEDVGLTLGQALSQALKERKGIKRYGFLLPMDDTLAEVAVDLSGRPYLVFNCKFKREKVGDLPTEMVEHFFGSLAESLKANIHINIKYSRNEHHKIEAIFKAFAKAMRTAVDKDFRQEGALPSTKGLL